MIGFVSSRRAAMRLKAGPARWRRLLLMRRGAVLLLPVLTLFLVVFGSAVADYSWIQQFDDFWSVRPSFRHVLANKLLGALHAPEATRLRQSIDVSDTRTPSIRLDVNAAPWDR